MTCSRCHLAITATREISAVVVDQRTKPRGDTYNDKSWSTWLDSREILSFCERCYTAWRAWVTT